jgi:hypothetical protein
MPSSGRVARRPRSSSSPSDENASKKSRVDDDSSPCDAPAAVTSVEPKSAKEQAKATPMAPATPVVKKPKSSASHSVTCTPSVPSQAPPVKVDLTALPPDVMHMLESVEEDGVITRSTEPREVLVLTQFCEDIDRAWTRLCSDDETQWPTMKELVHFFGRFCTLQSSNAQSKVGMDFAKALQSKNLHDLRFQLKAARDYASATRTGLTTDSPQRRGHSRISDRQRQALKNWRWVPEENNYESFDVMTKEEAHTVLSALIAAKHKPSEQAEINDVVTISA